MEQYIPKSALLAKIERKINEINLDNIEDWRYRLQREHDIEVMKNILSLINTLEVKEVDLEKEIKEYINDEWCDEWSGDVGNWIRCRRGTTPMEVEDVKDIAKHFFELGMQVSNKQN